MLRACALSAILVASCHAGTDGAMALYYEQQLTTGKLDNYQHDKPIGIDAAGRLVPAVLKVGWIVNRGHAASSQYGDIHRWIKGFVSYGVGLIFVFDGLARYPPKAARAHKERAEKAEKAKAEAKRLDAAGDTDAVDKRWCEVVHRETLLDLMCFAQQLLNELKVRWVVAPYEADHLLAYMAERNVITAVHPPHGDSDLPVYGIPNILFRLKASGEFSSLRARDHLLGKVVESKPTSATGSPGRVDLSQVRSMDTFACCVLLGGCGCAREQHCGCGRAWEQYGGRGRAREQHGGRVRAREQHSGRQSTKLKYSYHYNISLLTI